jgi:arabinoxylan arabinofuranohydrolase
MSTNRRLEAITHWAPWVGVLLGVATPARADNPIVQTNYTADPAPMVHEGTLYLYTSHDEDVTVNNFYTMNDWRLYSTQDMVNWTDHGSPAGLRSFTWGTDSAWAPHGIARNGEFYLYVPLNNNTGARIGVGVSDDVAGPFTDPLGRDLAQSPSSDIDPTVFIDDDGQAHMYWGNATLQYVRLNEDMISYSGTPTAVALSGFTEGPWFYKRESLYYMVYAGMGGATEKVSYATSNSPTGPWNIRGDIMASGSTFTNHAGVVDYKGHSYFFYHNSALPGGNDFKRSVCVEEFTYAADGSIPQLTMSADGPDAVATLNPFERVEAETIAFSSGLKTENSDDTGGGLNITQISAGDYIKVKNVDFLAGVTSFEARVSSSGSDARIELRLDSQSGTLLGTCDVSGASSWTTTTCPVSGGSGTHDLFLVFTGSADDLEFNWWKFTGPTLPMDGGTGDTGGAVGAGGSSEGGIIGPGSATATEGDGVVGESGGSGAGNAAMPAGSSGSDNGAGGGPAINGGQAVNAEATGSKSQGGCSVGPRHTRADVFVVAWLAAACALRLGRRRRVGSI